MSNTISLMGGKSVHCINEQQMKEGLRLAENDPESSTRIQRLVDMAEAELTRNERAALAFKLISDLKTA
jgi:hypothetical protein